MRRIKFNVDAECGRAGSCRMWTRRKLPNVDAPDAAGLTEPRYGRELANSLAAVRTRACKFYFCGADETSGTPVMWCRRDLVNFLSAIRTRPCNFSFCGADLTNSLLTVRIRPYNFPYCSAMILQATRIQSDFDQADECRSQIC